MVFLLYLWTTGWLRPTRCGVYISHFLHKSHMIRGSFAERDLQLEAPYASSQPWSELNSLPQKTFFLIICICVGKQCSGNVTLTLNFNTIEAQRFFWTLVFWILHICVGCLQILRGNDQYAPSIARFLLQVLFCRRDPRKWCFFPNDTQKLSVHTTLLVGLFCRRNLVYKVLFESLQQQAP